MTDFVHLHVHSEYSLVDSIISIKALLAETARHETFAVALTDHNLYAMVKFYQQAHQEKIKPLIGADCWIEDRDSLQASRLLLLCQNQVGFKNLTYLISKAHIENQQQQKPVIKRTWLQEATQGLIAITPHQHGEIGKALLAQQDNIPELISFWQELFPQRFYCGISRTERVDDDFLVQATVSLMEHYQLPPVALNEVCFLQQADFEAHEARLCIQEGYTLTQQNRPRYYSDQQYLKTPAQMRALFIDIPEACDNTVEIAKRCNLTLDLHNVYLPKFPTPDKSSVDDYLRAQAQAGLSRCQGTSYTREHYQQRLQEELDVIIRMGFAGYFLIVADFIKWAKKQGIPIGPGRGSGAGSLVAYVLEITGLDPLVYDLLFERFLNPERVSMPDFDIDFCMEGRDRVIEYVGQTYGRDAVAQIITYGTMAAKAVVRDVGRVLDFPYGFVDKIAKLIPFEVGMTLPKAIAQEEALQQRYAEEEDVKTLLDLGQKLEGTVRNVGKHAGGVVIAPTTLTEFTPLYCEDNGAPLVTQFDKNDIETIGLVKFDFLGLRTLTIIDWAVKAVNQHRATPLDIADIPLDDTTTFKHISTGQTTAVFQLESRGMKDLIQRLQPDRFDDLIALVALFRPGPLQSGMVDDYISRRHGAAVSYPHPLLEKILAPTYGIILYQEQVMQIAQVLSGYTLGGADLLRRAMGKKKPEEMAQQRDVFIQGAEKNNDVDPELAAQIFDLIEKFAGYGFNKSHSAAYAMLTYQTAWLKTHYSADFMAAVLSADMANTDKIVGLLDDCAYLDIEVLLPDVNKSGLAFKAEGQAIRYGLGAIKGLGENVIKDLVVKRDAGPFRSLQDFCCRIDIKKTNRRSLEALIKAGACDTFDVHRAQLLYDLTAALATAEQIYDTKTSKQRDLFGHATAKLVPQPAQEPLTETKRLQYEKEALGLYLTGHPITPYKAELEHMVSCELSDVAQHIGQKITIAGVILTLKTMQTKKGDRMAFLTLDDHTTRLEVAVFPEAFKAGKDLLQKDNLVLMVAEPKAVDGTCKVGVQQIYTLSEARSKLAQGIQLVVHAERWQAQLALHLKKILQQHAKETGCPVQVVYVHPQKTAFFQLIKPILLEPTIALVDKIKELLGDDSVRLIYAQTP